MHLGFTYGDMDQKAIEFINSPLIMKEVLILNIETRAIHVGHDVDSSTGAIAAPIYLTTTYEREADGSYPKEYVYSRLNNPNRQNLEQAIANLEGGTVAAAFSSGLAAIMTIFQVLSAGDHVV